MNNRLYHHGIKGMKWGVRRYQNKDGTLTAAGKKRLVDKMTIKFDKNYEIALDNPTIGVSSGSRALTKTYKDMQSEIESSGSKKSVASLKNARDKYYESMKLSEDFSSNKNAVRKFREAAYRQELDDYKRRRAQGEDIDEDYSNPKYVKDEHMNGNRDGDPGGSFDLYLKSKGTSYSDYKKKVLSAKKEYEKAQKKYVNKLLGRYGKYTVANYLSAGGDRILAQDAKTFTNRALRDMVDDTINRRGYIS